MPTPARKPPARRPVKKPVAAPKPKVEPVEDKPDQNYSPGRPGPFQICTDCYPDGWPKSVTGLSCQHGVWSRPWVI